MPMSPQTGKLTAKRLRELLDYNPRTGVFTWRVNRRGRFARRGVKAGTINGEGYRQISIDCVVYLCSRLAVLWMTGRWPIQLVDHRNLNTSDDRWENLRRATHSQNGANARARGHFKGVTFVDGKYQAQIRVNYRNIYLGRFDDPEVAHMAYVAASQKHFKEYARCR